MGKNRTKPLDSQSPSAALRRLREDVLKLRQQVEAEQARADAIKVQRRDQLADAK